MTELEQVEFHGPVRGPGGGPRRRLDAGRAGLLATAGVLVVVGVAAAMSALPSAASGADPSASPAPAATGAAPNASAAPAAPAPKGNGPSWRGLPGPFGGPGAFDDSFGAPAFSGGVCARRASHERSFTERTHHDDAQAEVGRQREHRLLDLTL